MAVVKHSLLVTGAALLALLGAGPAVSHGSGRITENWSAGSPHSGEWTRINDVGASDPLSVAQEGAGQGSNWYISTVTENGESPWYFRAGHHFFDDRHHLYSTTFSVRLRASSQNVGTVIAADDVILSGAGMTLVHRFAAPPPANGQWTTRSVPLYPCFWKHQGTGQAVTGPELFTLLADITDLRVRGTYYPGTSAVSLDDVDFGSPQGASALVSARSLNFGKVKINKRRGRTLKIGNAPNAAAVPLCIHVNPVADEGFGTASGEVEVLLQPGEEWRDSVYFQPVRRGRHSGTLKITTSETQRRYVEISLKGAGTGGRKRR